NAETEITESCVSYLLFDSFESGPCQTRDELQERLKINNLYDYSSHNWGHHALEALTLSSGVMGFLEHDMKVEALSQALMRSNYA
ncbi:uncharacterized protein ASPGLDRAFT_138442, partial [Aspergillus glaucus CBS 516.65]